MELGTLLAGRFEVHEPVGAGGMGQVYRATDLLTGRLVAVKVQRGDTPSLAERFGAEALTLARVASPAVVAYVSHGFSPRGDAWLAMEWLDGPDLAQRLRRGRLACAEAVALGLRVAEGLGAAHALGLIHRDVKPANVLLVAGQPARATLVDFGIAGQSAARGPSRAPGPSSAPRATWPPSRSRGARTSAPPRTCSRSAACSTSASPGTRPSGGSR